MNLSSLEQREGQLTEICSYICRYVRVSRENARTISLFQYTRPPISMERNPDGNRFVRVECAYSFIGWGFARVPFMLFLIVVQFRIL